MGLLITLDFIKQYIKKNEGLCLDVRVDALGNRVIGYGHILKQYSKFTKVNEEQAEKWFKKDFCWAFTKAQQWTDNYRLLLPLTDMYYEMKENADSFCNFKAFRNKAYTEFIYDLVYRSSNKSRALSPWVKQSPKRAKQNILLLCEELDEIVPTDLIRQPKRG